MPIVNNTAADIGIERLNPPSDLRTEVEGFQKSKNCSLISIPKIPCSWEALTSFYVAIIRMGPSRAGPKTTTSVIAGGLLLKYYFIIYYYYLYNNSFYNPVAVELFSYLCKHFILYK